MLVLSATVFGVLAVSGAPRRWLALLAGGAVTAAVAAVAAGVLKQYQVDRFLAFTNPDLDPRGAGYNVEQARIAVGNGGLFGQGLFDGSQTRAGFVPEQHTDFVFTVAGEELGLVGAGVLIALLGVVIWRALSIAARTDDVFGRLAAAGIACWFGFQAFQNVGMCLGIMPVTGVPLPFVSYGGSSMFAGHARDRAAAEHPPALERRAPDPLHDADAGARLVQNVRVDREEHERRQQHQVHAALQRLRAAGHDGQHRDDHRDRAAARSGSGSRPSASGPSSQIEATAIAGMVRPMLAIAEP